MRFDHIFFDSGGTLYDSGNRSETTPAQVSQMSTMRVHAYMHGMGVDVDIAHLGETIRHQTDICKKRMGDGYSFFRMIEAVVIELGLPLGPEEAACLADAYAGPRYASWLFPGTKEALQALGKFGFRMGIIANTAWPGYCMDRAFAGVGILSFFSTRVYSSDIGIAKPSPLIFRHAERISGVEGKGKRILYVGNSLEADVKGASAAGWSTAFRRSCNNGTGGLADLEFDDFSELVHFCVNRKA